MVYLDYKVVNINNIKLNNAVCLKCLNQLPSGYKIFENLFIIVTLLVLDKVLITHSRKNPFGEFGSETVFRNKC